MQRIKIMEYAACDAAQKALYDGQIAAHGRITNMKKTLLNNPPSFRVLMEWYTMRDELQAFLNDFEINVFAYSISSENDCVICSTFFRKILKDAGRDPDRLTLTEKESLLAEYGAYLVKSPRDIPDSFFNRLKGVFGEEYIVALTAFGAMMIATNLINNALDIPLDEYLVPYTRR